MSRRVQDAVRKSRVRPEIATIGIPAAASCHLPDLPTGDEDAEVGAHVQAVGSASSSAIVLIGRSPRGPLPVVERAPRRLAGDRVVHHVEHVTRHRRRDAVGRGCSRRTPRTRGSGSSGRRDPRPRSGAGRERARGQAEPASMRVNPTGAGRSVRVLRDEDATAAGRDPHRRLVARRAGDCDDVAARLVRCRTRRTRSGRSARP